MAKANKVKWDITVTVTDTVPEGAKPFKKKDIVAAIQAKILHDGVDGTGPAERLTETKIKVTPVE